MATLLLEIGTEELPADYLPPALAQLEALAKSRLRAERIAVNGISVWGTPRRIVLLATGVAAEQTSAVHDVRGPAAQAAFAPNGEPTQAAIGFARSQGVPLNELRIASFDGHEYVVVSTREEGRPAHEVLAAVFPDLITGLSFPQTMRWGSGTLRFARPIRWLVALLDGQVVPFTLGEVSAGRQSYGHRILAPGPLEIASASEYRETLAAHFVMVAPDERREAIRHQLNAIANDHHATVVDDGSLLEETTFLLEYPTAVRCTFDESFLMLPADLLLLILRKEQRYFPLATPAGALLPAFLAVRDGDATSLDAIRENYQGVARAKLLDALFFYEQDRLRPLAERIEALRGVVFQERLGTVHDKVERTQALAGMIADWLGFPRDERLLAERAALLSKADLVTSVVIEHPELQGVMGGVYARLSGEPAAIAAAISEHYRPRSAGDLIPATPLGRVVALADKVDTVVGCFAVGLISTSSEDPYALRRESQGVVRILAEANYRIAIPTLLAAALTQLHAEQAQPAEETLVALETYFRQRLETLLTNTGIPLQVTRAVMAISADVPADALRRAEAIQRRLDTPELATVARVATRLANITKNFPGEVMRAELLTEPAERELLARYQEVAPRAEFLAARGEFAALLELLATLAPAVDRYFTEVLVMAEDPALRHARLTLAWRLTGLFHLLADFTQMSGEVARNP